MAANGCLGKRILRELNGLLLIQMFVIIVMAWNRAVELKERLFVCMSPSVARSYDERSKSVVLRGL
jgi:hypothetical protein